MAGFASANLLERVPEDEVLPAEFTVKAPPETDIWAKPPSTERFNAPILYKSIPLDTFKRARVAFSANWSQKYDQGGLIIVLNGNSGDRKWVKTGIEFTHDKPHLSTVAKDRWADWSLLPVPSGGTGATPTLSIHDGAAADALKATLFKGYKNPPSGKSPGYLLRRMSVMPGLACTQRGHQVRAGIW